MQNASEQQELNTKQHLSGYELTYNTIHNLKNYDLTATAKLVLILLTTHYNEQKNGAVVFPSIPFISDTLGIGQTAVKQAIKDLILKGLIIKSKRGKIKGNYNKYLLTLKVQNTTPKQSENELSKQSDSDLFHEHEPVNKNLSKETTNKGKNVVAFISKKSKPVSLDDVPNLIKNNKKIKDACAYWASLSTEVKQKYLQKEKKQKENRQKREEIQKAENERKIQEQKELQEELSKPLNEQYTREQAVQFVSKVHKINRNFAYRGLAGELVKIYEIQESEL